MSSCGCACSAAPKLIFSCSGAADVGAVADQAARALTREGCGKMFCLAGIGGRVSGIMQTTEAAADILVIDGCALGCAGKCLKEAGFSTFKYLELSELGMKKGKTPICDEAIQKVMTRGRELLG